MKPLIAVPIGDPAGIGPEIVAKALCEPEVFEKAVCIVIGDKKIMENALYYCSVTNVFFNHILTTSLRFFMLPISKSA